MALTTNQLAFALRLTADASTAPDSSIAAELTRLAGVADAFIADYASMAPEGVRDEAKRLMVGYLYDGPDFNPGGTGLLYVNAFRNSGAQALLSPWRVRRAGLIGPAGAAGAGAAAGTGLDRAALIALIDQRIAAGGGGNGESPAQPGAGLTTQQLADLRSSIDREGISISGRDIEFVDHEGISVTVTVPGITVLDEGTILLADGRTASADQVDELVFTGTDVTAARLGNRVTVTFSGLTVAQVEGLIAAHGSLTQLEQFEAALRTETAIITAVSTTVSSPNTAVRFTGLPKVPAADHDRELVVRVGAGLHHRIDVSTLRAKATATRPTLLDDTNSVPFVDGDDTFRIAREAGDDALLFSASTAATYAVTITDSQIDLQPAARRSAPPLATTIRGAVQAAVTGDVTLATDGDKLLATLKANNVDPADLRITSGRVAGKLLRISDDVASLVGVDLPAPGTTYGARILHDGALTGLAVTNSSMPRASNATAFSTTVDVFTATPDNPSAAYVGDGEFHYELTITLSNPSDTTLRFLGTSSAPDTEVETSGIVFASKLKAQDIFVLGGTVEGQEIAAYPVKQGTVGAAVGTIYVYIVTVNSQRREVQYALAYEGASGSYTFNFSFNMKLSFIASDPGSASYVPVPVGIATGQLVRKSATGWESYTPPAPGGGSATVAYKTLTFPLGANLISGARGKPWENYGTALITSGVPAENKIIAVYLQSGKTNRGTRQAEFFRTAVANWDGKVPWRTALGDRTIGVGNVYAGADANALTLHFPATGQARITADMQGSTTALDFRTDGVKMHVVYIA